MSASSTTTLSGSLEDYLETIYELVRDKSVARVRDIAKARGVRAGSVSPAMGRLAKLGLVKYVQREYIELTDEGERAARRVYARHQALTTFLQDILKMPPRAAKADACAMEHSLSLEGMDHLVRFIEFLRVCPQGKKFLDKFHTCSAVQVDVPPCPFACAINPAAGGAKGKHKQMSIAQLQPGQRGRVKQINGTGPIRQRLLDMGMLPDVEVELERVAPAGDPLWIKLQGFQLSLRRSEAESVLVSVL